VAATIVASTAITESYTQRTEHTQADGGVELTVPLGETVVVATAGPLAGYGRRTLASSEAATIEVVVQQRATVEVRVIDAQTERSFPQQIDVMLSPGSGGFNPADGQTGSVTSFSEVIAGEQLLTITDTTGAVIQKKLRVEAGGKHVITVPFSGAR
jgi:hypothetical protein